MSFSHSVFAPVQQYTAQYRCVLIILRGLPGSGKSTLARAILSTFGSEVCCICSADDYFYTPDGTYCYNPEFISDAHVYCRHKVSKQMSGRRLIIVLDNTNVRIVEFLPYLSMAASHDYLTIVTEPNTSWKFDITKLAHQNIHSVSKKKLQEMAQNFEPLRPVNPAEAASTIDASDTTNVSSNAATGGLVDAVVSDSKHGTVYCVKSLICDMQHKSPTANNVSNGTNGSTASDGASKSSTANHRHRQPQPHSEYRQPEMMDSFNRAFERVSSDSEWRNFNTVGRVGPQPVTFDLPETVCSEDALQDRPEADLELEGNSSRENERQDELAYLTGLFPAFDTVAVEQIHSANSGDLAATVAQLESMQAEQQINGCPVSQLREIFPSLSEAQLASAYRDSGGDLEAAAAALSVADVPSSDGVAASEPHPAGSDINDDSALAGLFNKRTILAMHRQLAPDSRQLGELLEGLDEALLAQWRPPDSVLTAVFAAFLAHIGAKSPLQPDSGPAQSAGAGTDSGRWRTEAPLAYRMSLERLTREFPGLSEEAAATLYADCGSSFEAAYATLLEYGLTPTEPSDEKQAPSTSGVAAFEATSVGGEASVNVYSELSLVSRELRGQRRDCLERAAYARDPRAQAHHMRQAASLAELERQRRTEIVDMATADTSSLVGSGGAQWRQLDLHGMTASEAIQAIKATLSRHGNSLKALRVITGHGRHSSSGPVLRPVVSNFLRQKGLQFEEPYLGCFHARLT